MFEITQLEEITASVKGNMSNLTVLTTEHCAALLVAESVKDLTRPIRRLSSNQRIAIQQQFNRSIALMITKADSSTNEALTELMMQAAMRVQSAQQAGEEEATQQAVERLERVINFLADLSSNVARNGFYRYEECERKETPAADGAKVTGVDGAVGAFETRSSYAGWSQVIVESTTMEDAVNEAVTGLHAAIKALLPMASAYLNSLFLNDKKDVVVQLGYRALEGGEYDRFYTVKDLWKDIRANRREAIEPMSAEDAIKSFKL